MLTPHPRPRKNRKTGHGKRGTGTYDKAMIKAKNQAERYARALDGIEISGGRPPFLLVCDVGHSISVYADWSRAGGHYQPFPDPASYRVQLTDLHDEENRERLRLIWTDPLSLDPARRSKSGLTYDLIGLSFGLDRAVAIELFALPRRRVVRIV